MSRGSLRPPLLGITVALALAIPIATAATGAAAAPPFGVAGVPPQGPVALGAGPDSCGDNAHLDQQGANAGTAAKACLGAGLVFVGPAIGQVASVMGPTVIGPALVNSVVSGGGVLLG